MKTLIKGGTVLTMGRTNFTEADVLVEDELVVEVGLNLRARGAEVIDAAERVVMPGFVDGHHHVAEALYRNTGSAPRDAPDLSPDDLHAATLVGLFAALENGITTVADWVGTAEIAHLEAILTAHDESGARTVAVVPFAGGAGRVAIEHARRSQGSRRSLAVGVDTGDALEDARALAGEFGIRVHLHRLPAAGDVAALGSRSLLDASTVITHCSSLDEADLDAIESGSASVVLSPASQMTAGLGTPPVQGLTDRGIRPGLGVGTVVETPGDLFAQMRSVISIQHAETFDRKLLGKGGLPKLMTTREVIRHATVDGASAIGLGGSTGVLEPGMQADLILLAMDRPNIFPVNDPIGAVVWGMDTSNVDTVLVAGSVLKRGGELTTDTDAARSAASAAVNRLAGAAIGGTR